MKVKFKPLGDRVLIFPSQAPDKTESGLLIPETAKERPLEGTIAAVGSGTKLYLDDQVLFGKWSGSEITLEGVKYLILKEDEVIGIL